MKSPITGKEMKLIREERTVDFRKEKFKIVFHCYRDEENGEQFTTTELDQLNQNQIYNQYRVRLNIPFPDEIRHIREKYDVSATKMSEILGFGVNGYRQYEAGEMPSVSNARLIQLANNPENFINMVSVSDALDSRAKNKCLQKATELADKYKELVFENKLREYLLGTHKPDELSGYRAPNLKKFTGMVIFFAQQVKPFKTKLNKLLFFADFAMFKRTCFSISGARYRAIKMGPVPVNFNSLFEYLENEKEIGINYIPYPEGFGEQFVTLKDKPFDEKIFSEFELEVLNLVAKKFEKVSTTDIIEISHSEEAWRKNEKEKKEINYKDAFELKAI